jgi:glycerophosphoryl diester phosphodiesterase
MLKRTTLCLSLALLAGCNDDNNHTTTIQPIPEYQEPKLLIVGHRGASGTRPEHTLAAYQKAIDDGADFIEPDLVPTKDGYLVARHESEIKETSNIITLAQFADRLKTKTIDGVNYEGWFTEDFNLSELQQLKARERIPDIRPANTQYNDLYDIPTLEQIIELTDAHYRKTGKIIGLYIETKHPSYFASLGLAMEDTLLKTLAKYEYTRDIAPVYLQSFEVSNLQYLKQQLDQHKTLRHAKIVQLYSGKNSQPADYVLNNTDMTYGDLATLEGLKFVASYADGVGPSKTYILPNSQPATPTSFVQDAHQYGLKVHPYTLRSENNFLPNYLDCSQDVAEYCEAGALKEFELFFKAGVDGVFTDDPALGRKAADLFLTQKAK